MVAALVALGKRQCATPAAADLEHATKFVRAAMRMTESVDDHGVIREYACQCIRISALPSGLVRVYHVHSIDAVARGLFAQQERTRD